MRIVCLRYLTGGSSAWTTAGKTDAWPSSTQRTCGLSYQQASRLTCRASQEGLELQPSATGVTAWARTVLSTGRSMLWTLRPTMSTMRLLSSIAAGLRRRAWTHRRSPQFLLSGERPSIFHPVGSPLILHPVGRFGATWAKRSSSRPRSTASVTLTALLAAATAAAAAPGRTRVQPMLQRNETFPQTQAASSAVVLEAENAAVVGT
mmetsp:Transcript_21225/g.46822  ORF Transcript_21225/g.46822 Transcript_21225/m.46822 type:complete len:206 (-) Transcript_21225:242-859(-)